jgi:UDP-2,4-diacetamido-2,4,6-trideoxy-beta-L-altropyranose hydrolase
MSDLLLIRADGSARIGSGHVMRCLALAQGWQRVGGRAVFAQAESTPSLKNRLGADDMEVLRLDVAPGSIQDAAQTSRLALEQGAAWVVADGYGFGADWQKTIKDAGLRLLLWDDYSHAEYYSADLILNQNLHATPGMYPRREPYTQLLLGPRYAQLRDEFLQWRGWKRQIPAVARKILITLGGADPDNVTSKAVQALADLRDVEAVVVAGGNNPNIEALRSAVAPLSGFVRLVVDAPNMPELMAWADIAVSAAGSTCLELAFMGLPSLMIALTEEHAEIAAALDREGVGVNLGKHRDLSIERLAVALESTRNDLPLREQMSDRGRQLVSGMGVSRVITRLYSVRLTLRRAVTQDCRLIWEWANDPEARAVSFSSDPIPWESHECWFAAKLRDRNCLFYVGVEPDNNPIGQIRFDVTGAEGVVSVSLAPQSRGKGLGPALIVQGAEQLFAQSDAHVVHAYIKTENQGSVIAFEKADFEDAGVAEICGRQARHFALHRKAA